MRKFVRYISPFILLLVILVIPFIFDFLFKNNPSLFEFIGNYSGGLIGGIVAFIIAKYQLNEYKKEEKNSKLKEQIPVFVKLYSELEKIEHELSPLTSFCKNSDESDFIKKYAFLRDLSEVYWGELGKITDSKLHIDLFHLKDKYQSVLETMQFDLFNAENTLEKYEQELKDFNENYAEGILDSDDRYEYFRISNDYNRIKSHYNVIKKTKKEFYIDFNTGTVLQQVNQLKDEMSRQYSLYDRL